jgi:hypothetical protein
VTKQPRAYPKSNFVVVGACFARTTTSPFYFPDRYLSLPVAGFKDNDFPEAACYLMIIGSRMNGVMPESGRIINNALFGISKYGI